LMVYYQPQVNTRTHELTGLEALLRWNHPTRGMVPPMEFIQAAEESGMIVPIGEWVVRQACREARQMQIATGHRFTIAVNLSPRQVLQNNLFEVVEAALNDSGLAAMDLELEITENTLMISTSETLATLARLRQLGVRLAVDDFGTGFSSFQYILDYKVDRLKIDRSFTANCASDTTAAAIVRTVIAMAHGLNMTVVAEGVENDEQLAFLHRRRCDVAQGYLFGRPVPMAELEGVIATSAAGDSYSLKRMLAEGSTAKPKSEAVMAFTEATIAIG
jgi:EAL domain-containing protein (putative c-di-GMP-specific phosphodiesterase class I)